LKNVNQLRKKVPVTGNVSSEQVHVDNVSDRSHTPFTYRRLQLACHAPGDYHANLPLESESVHIDVQIRANSGMRTSSKPNTGSTPPCSGSNESFNWAGTRDTTRDGYALFVQFLNKFQEIDTPVEEHLLFPQESRRLLDCSRDRSANYRKLCWQLPSAMQLIKVLCCSGSAFC